MTIQLLLLHFMNSFSNVESKIFIKVTKVAMIMVNERHAVNVVISPTLKQVGSCLMYAVTSQVEQPDLIW